jgi:preprotein translocase subunit SecE
MVGLRRYVHIAFVAMGILAAFVLSNIFVYVSDLVGWSYSILGADIWSLLAYGISGVGAFLLWRNSQVFGFAEEVAQELKKVTWPSYEETRISTFVVIAIVAIGAIILGVFDFVWSGATNALVQWITS